MYREDDKLFEKAAALGLDVVLPEANQLQIDLDSQVQYTHYLNMATLLRGKGFVFDEEIAPSKSGLPNRHVTLTFPSCEGFSPWMRVALQASLGSDPKRELLSCVRIFNEDPHPTGFMELPVQEDLNALAVQAARGLSEFDLDCDFTN